MLVFFCSILPHPFDPPLSQDKRFQAFDISRLTSRELLALFLVTSGIFLAAAGWRGRDAVRALEIILFFSNSRFTELWPFFAPTTSKTSTRSTVPLPRATDTLNQSCIKFLQLDGE